MRSNSFILGATLAAATLGTSLLAGCGSDDSDDVIGADAIVFLQRPARNEMGDIFQYTSYRAGARIVKLSPPTADGELTVLCCDQDAAFAAVDISGYDLSFDAREIVFSAKLSEDTSYGLYVLTLDDGGIEQIMTNPSRDYTQPVFLPGDKILFMTNEVVEEGAPQHRDEYERGTTLQVGSINRDGTGENLAARNLSHRVHPTVTADGRVLMTQWDHLGDENSGHLMFINPDGSTLREAYGKEGTGVSNSYLKAREIAPGRVVAIGTSRDRTIQAGALLDIRLGKPDGSGGYSLDMTEANATYRILTPDVPLGEEPSSNTIGRYYDAFPLNAKESPDLLVSWANGPVESGTLAAAGLNADFGIFVFDSARKSRRPIFDAPDTWDVFARPLVARDAPPQIASAGKHQFNQEAALIGSMDVYQSSLDTFEPGSIYGVRVIEGFSVEEGVPDDFGITEHEGAAVLGVSPVYPDGSWAALIPANVPVHVQPINEYGLSLRSEPVWFSAGPGESRMCGGCHEPRDGTTVIQPGLAQAVAAGPADLKATVSRANRVSPAALTRDATVGVPWDTALQDIFDAKCVSCHNGSADATTNPSWTISDPETGESFTWAFNLSGDQVNYGIGDEMFGGYSASHLSLMGPDMMELEESGLVITGDIKIYVEPGNALESELIKKLNPPQQFPSQDFGNRAFGASVEAHALAVGQELTADEYYLLILMADNGGQFYSRENAPGGSY